MPMVCLTRRARIETLNDVPTTGRMHSPMSRVPVFFACATSMVDQSLIAKPIAVDDPFVRVGAT
jgi:hypothetical protein